MSSKIDWSQFEPVEQQQEEPAFDWNQFEPVEKSKAYRDVVGEELSSKGFEDDENEFERMYEKGSAEAGRGLLSGASFGLTENIPTMKPEKGTGTEVAKFTGSLIPITGLQRFFTAPLIRMATNSPKFQKSLSALANLTGAFATGATVKGAETAFKGEMPSVEDVALHGAEWAALDAALQTLGVAGRFGAALLKKSKATGKSKFSIINNVLDEMKSSGEELGSPEKITEKALEILENPGEPAKKVISLKVEPTSPTETVSKEILGKPAFTAQDLTERKIKPEIIKQNIQPLAEKAEGYNLSEMDTEALTKDLEKIPSNSAIEKIGTRAESELALGENIQKDIDQQFLKEKQTYEPLYAEVEQGSKGINTSPESAITKVKSARDKINSLKTRPEGYQKVLSTLEDVLSDLGVTELEVSPKFKGRFPAIVEQIPVQKLMELGRRLNKIIDYDIIGSSIKDELKPIVKAVKQEIRMALGRKDPELAKLFDTAEKNYGKTAEKFGTDAIGKIRGVEASENIAKRISSPTAVKQLKQIASPAQFKQIEREILENAKDLNHTKIKDLQRELRGIISKEAEDALTKLAEDKLPLGKISREKRLRTGIADDIVDAISTGQRPEKTLKLWKTPKGQKLINDALKDTPNRKEILDYLQTQSLYDLASSVVDNTGKINFKKFKEFMADPAVINNLRAMGGDEAVSFFKNIEKLSNRLDHNLNLQKYLPKPSKAERGETLLKRSAEKQTPKESKVANEVLQPAPKGRENRLIASERAEAEKIAREKGKEILKRIRNSEVPLADKMESVYEALGIPGKAILSFLGYMKFGMPKSAVALVGAKLLHKLAKNKKARDSFIQAVNVSSQSPPEAFALLNLLSHDVEEE